MSDTSPRDQAALLWQHRRDAAAPKPRLREFVFELVRADHVRFRCEFVDCGEFGIDVQILRDEEFSYSRRWPSRTSAIIYAESERIVLMDSVQSASRGDAFGSY